MLRGVNRTLLGGGGRLLRVLTQAADGSVQPDVVEVGLGSLPVPRVLLGPVLHIEHLLLAVGRVGVEVDLGVHAHHC